MNFFLKMGKSLPKQSKKKHIRLLRRLKSMRLFWKRYHSLYNQRNTIFTCKHTRLFYDSGSLYNMEDTQVFIINCLLAEDKQMFDYNCSQDDEEDTQAIVH